VQFIGGLYLRSAGSNYKQAFRYRIDIPETIQGSEAVRAIDGHDLAKPSPFPSDLCWFLSHVHGSAKNHVFAGQTGILAIDPQDADPTTAFRAGADEQFLVLRDIPVAVPSEHMPNQLASDQRNRRRQKVGNWISGTTTTHSLSPSFCAMNGIMGLMMTVNPGRKQIWRIANTTRSGYFNRPCTATKDEIYSLCNCGAGLERGSHVKLQRDHPSDPRFQLGPCN